MSVFLVCEIDCCGYSAVHGPFDTRSDAELVQSILGDAEIEERPVQANMSEWREKLDEKQRQEAEEETKRKQQMEEAHAKVQLWRQEHPDEEFPGSEFVQVEVGVGTITVSTIGGGGGGSRNSE